MKEKQQLTPLDWIVIGIMMAVLIVGGVIRMLFCYIVELPLLVVIVLGEKTSKQIRESSKHGVIHRLVHPIVGRYRAAKENVIITCEFLLAYVVSRLFDESGYY
ncbi:hypothetical protein ACFL2D_00125 [Patescibacteria group bacterium]